MYLGKRHTDYFFASSSFKGDEKKQGRAKKCVRNYQYKYNGKELQTELGLNIYNYGNRNYDPALGRFFNMDRFSEKYVDYNPYQYTKNNPIYYVDYKGDSLTLTADKREYIDQTVQTMNNGLGGNYVNADENGLITISATDEQIASMNDEQKAFYNVLNGAADMEQSNVSIGIVSEEGDVQVGHYDNEQIDIADISKHPTDGAGNMYAKIGHEVEEQVQKQRYGVSYKDGAHSAGMKVEAKISGVSFRYDPRGIIVKETRNKQTIATRYGTKSGGWVTLLVTFDTNGKIVKTKQVKGDVTK